MRAMRLAIFVACVAALLVVPAAAAASHKTRPHTSNMHALGHSPDPGDFELPDGQRDVNSDLAFWGDLVFQGDYDGFRVMTRGPGDPQLVSRTRCNGDQGDIVVWEDILVRSWNTKRADPRNCDGSTVPANWEGVHVFDISNIEDPRLVAAVEMPCGSHTATGVPDHANDRLIVYSNNSSSSGCTGGSAAGDFMDVIAVPFDNPAGASMINRVPLAGPVQAGVATGSHDAGVILGDENKVAVASADITNVFDIGDNETPGGSLTNPVLLFTIQEPGVGIPSGEHHAGRWHSAAFTWDGEVIILGWEPGGGAEAECEASDPAVTKSAFFYDADTGAKLGQWTLPRPQGADENCTIHNYNTVPLRNGRYVLAGGHYQAGTWVVDFTNPANPVTLGWSDPPSAGPGTSCDNELPNQCTLTGAWSSYWYNGFIYEGHISEGLNVFRFSGNETAGAMRLPHLNPQTQEFTIG
jgi:hypothetical protein